MSAVIYVRISRDRHGTELGIRRQEPACRKLAEQNGWDVAEVIADNDVSAYKGTRPGYRRLCEGIQAGTWDRVLAWHPDRLHRSPRELEDFIDLLESTSTDVATVKAGEWDLATPTGRMIARQLGVIARYESEHRSERVRAKMDELAAAGKWSGGTRPYGYRPVDGALVIDPDEADRIREAARRVLAGEPVGAVCSDWNRLGVPTLLGKQWRAQTLRRVLTAPTVAGRRQHRGVDYGEAEWPAILEAGQWYDLRRVVLDPTRSRAAPARVALLAGLAVCGREGCGTKLRTAVRQTGVRVYICPAKTAGGCGALQVVAKPLEKLAAVMLQARADEIRHLRPAVAPDRGAALALAELEAELAEYGRQAGAGKMPRSTFDAFVEGAEVRRAEIEAGTVPHAVPVLDLTEWKTWALPQRQHAARSLLARVIVRPAQSRGPGFDDGRIEWVWL